jgi:serine/threonine-protein kinase RsbW
MSLWLTSSADRAQVPRDLVPMLEVCANEAVANIISYAYEDRQSHAISLELSRTDKGAALVIRDDGKPFNPLSLPEYEKPATLEDARIGGLGVHFVRKLMARCEYRREAGQNILCLEAEPKTHASNA